MEEWLNGNHWAAWLGLALVLGVVEAATVDFVFLMLAGGALAGMVAGIFTSSVAIQIVAAAVASLLLLGAVRPVLKRRMLDRLPGSGLGIETYAGRPASVTEPVDENDGRVMFDGEIWSARTDRAMIPVPVGAEVTILRVDGATLVVEPVSPVQDVVGRPSTPES
ncbi:NfeD family protein [Mobilicoccus massiliensis]|uniref:NfeD family protein n=1 Tax=Mobilicoccus massiliensis TaxID=1522310 RepID=UPI000693A577|nr:NfeD family protein [Mobilicoccus massiliensis]